MKKPILSVWRILVFSLIFSASVLSNSTSHAQLIAHYPMNGNNGLDLSGNGNHAANYGNIASAVDRYGIAGGAAYFDGTDGYFQCPPLGEGNQNLTFTFWIKLQNDGNMGTIFSKDATYHQHILPGGDIEWDVNGSLGWETSGPNPLGIPWNSWSHVAITIEPGLVKYYLNSNLISTGTFNGTMQYWGNDFFIGINGYWAEFGTNPLDAVLDDFKVFGSTFSAIEVQNAQNLELPSYSDNCTDPIANNYDPFAPFDDGSCLYYEQNCPWPEFEENFNLALVGNADDIPGFDGWGFVPSDALVTNLEAFYFQSMEVGNDEDIVCDLYGYNFGSWTVKTHVFVPSGDNGTYMSLLHDHQPDVVNTIFGPQVFVESSNSGLYSSIYAGGQWAYFDFPYDSWVEYKFVVDIDNNVAAFYVNGTFVTQWTWDFAEDWDYNILTNDVLHSLLFWGYCDEPGCSGLAYIDDITMCPGNLPGGCTDPNACGYDPDAIVDDGSCDYTDSDADGVFDCFDPCPFGNDGCMDPNADNFNPLATCDNGNCVYNSATCDSPIWEEGFNGYLVGDLESQSPDWTGWLNGSANSEVVDDIVRSPARAMKVYSDAQSAVHEFNINSGIYELKSHVFIPHWESAGGYMALYHEHSSVYENVEWAQGIYFTSLQSGNSCWLQAEGAWHPFSIPYGEWFEVRQLVDIDNNLTSVIINGNIVHTWPWDYSINSDGIQVAANSNMGALLYSGVCYSDNCEGNMWVDDITMCQLSNPIEGCMDPLACNYNPDAIIDFGLCDYPDSDGDGLYDCHDYCPFPGDEGCTDPAAANYDPAAICDNGNCVYYSDDCDSPIWEENFDGYTASNIDPQSPDWFGWGGFNSGADINSDISFSPSNSINIEGADDLVTEFNLNSGAYSLKINAFIPSGESGGYLNLLHNYDDDFFLVNWAADVFLASAQSWSYSQLKVGPDYFYFLIPYDNWFEMVFNIDIDNDLASFTCNGTLVHSWAWSIGTDAFNSPAPSSNLGALDFYATCTGYGCSPNAFYDNISLCSIDPLVGCTDPGACNYDSSALADDGSCDYTDSNNNGTPDCFDLGCMDTNANNYDPFALIDNGSCVYYSSSCAVTYWEDNFDFYGPGNIDAQSSDWFGWGGINSGADVVGFNSASSPNAVHIEGADDLVTEFNLSSGAYELKLKTFISSGDNGGYFNLLHNYSLDINQVEWACNVFMASSNSGAQHELVIDGATVATFNMPYDEWVEFIFFIDINNDVAEMYCNGAYIHGWTWSIGNSNGTSISNTNFAALDLFATCIGGGCIPDALYDDVQLCEVPTGCTDVDACNYDSSAVVDDGSCDYTDLNNNGTPDCFDWGCTDTTACNFDSQAMVDDGSCTYAPCGTCAGDADGNGFVNVLDLVAASSNFGCSAGCTLGDANFDGVVNVLDFVAISSNFGNICP